MNTNDFVKPKSSYKKLFVFQKSEAIYDLTYHFLQGHIAKSDRTYDQMLQAAGQASKILSREERTHDRPPKWR